MHRTVHDKQFQRCDRFLEQVLAQLTVSEEKQTYKTYLVGKQLSAADVTLATLMRPMRLIPYFHENERYAPIYAHTTRILKETKQPDYIFYEQQMALARKRRASLCHRFIDLWFSIFIFLVIAGVRIAEGLLYLCVTMPCRLVLCRLCRGDGDGGGSDEPGNGLLHTLLVNPVRKLLGRTRCDSLNNDNDNDSSEEAKLLARSTAAAPLDAKIQAPGGIDGHKTAVNDHRTIRLQTLCGFVTGIVPALFQYVCVLRAQRDLRPGHFDKRAKAAATAAATVERKID
jgi:hypothetical protein